MSCGQIAFERAGVKVKKYYASEIDKYAIQVTMKNYPDTVQLGSITEWKNWNIEKPDIIIGGSPCQGFSFAGKQLNFNDERSKLFFTFVDIVKYYNPKYFLLENVKMKKEYQKVISDCMGVEPIEINSALVSAQNRKRLYWTNIPNVTQPKDKGILLKDIIETGKADLSKANCLLSTYYKASSNDNGIKRYKENHMHDMIIESKNGKPIIIPENTETPFMLTETRSEKGKESRRKIRQETGKDSTKRDKDSKIYKPNDSGKANCILTSNADELSTVFIGKDSLCVQIGKANVKGHDYNKRVYSQEGKSPSLAAASGGNLEPKIAIRQSEKCENRRIANRKELNEKGNCLQASVYKGEAANGCAIINDAITWRKLTPLECEKLQTVPDNYTEGVSNSQRYKMLGNGWTVDVIAHIFRGLK